MPQNLHYLLIQSKSTPLLSVPLTGENNGYSALEVKYCVLGLKGLVPEPLCGVKIRVKGKEFFI
jgi:hypothetical protein